MFRSVFLHWRIYVWLCSLWSASNYMNYSTFSKYFHCPIQISKKKKPCTKLFSVCNHVYMPYSFHSRGEHGMYEYTELKTVTVKISQKNSQRIHQRKEKPFSNWTHPLQSPIEWCSPLNLCSVDFLNIGYSSVLMSPLENMQLNLKESLAF